MPSALRSNSTRLHPYGDEPVNWAWSRLGAQVRTVLIGIVRSVTLERYETLFREAGIPVSGITFSASAIHAALRLYNIPSTEFPHLDRDRRRRGRRSLRGEPQPDPLLRRSRRLHPHRTGTGAAELRLPDTTPGRAARRTSCRDPARHSHPPIPSPGPRRSPEPLPGWRNRPICCPPNVAKPSPAAASFRLLYWLPAS